jgi:hypothetical protein
VKRDSARRRPRFGALLRHLTIRRKRRGMPLANDNPTTSPLGHTVTASFRLRGMDASSKDGRAATPERLDGEGPPVPANPLLKSRYLLEAPLGQGSVGTTYRAYDETLKRVVAVKLTAERYAGDDEFARRFMAAAAAAGRLSHPNAVTVLDAGIHEGRPFVVMELVEGRSLRELQADDARIPVSQCIRIVAQAADAVHHAHRQGLIHGDVRPENVMISSRGAVKLADFGLTRAAVATDLTLLGSALKRAPYTAPEHFGGGRPTELSDVYALGVLLYELLTGVEPHAPSVALAAATQRPDAAPPPSKLRPDAPANLDHVVARATSADPRRRYASAQELRTALMAPRAEPRPEPEAPPAWIPPRSVEPRRYHRSGTDFGQFLATIIPVAATLALLGGAALLLTAFMPRLFTGLQIVEAPPLVDYELTEATSRASTLGLEAKVATAQPTEDRPAGVVLAQTPGPGTRLRRGSEIKLTISSGIRPPDVSGRSIDEARALLVRGGWEIAGLEHRADSDRPTGAVIGTRPGADQTATSKQEGLTLLVAAGNLAFRRPLLLSGGGPGPAEMVDGDPNTSGRLGGPAPSWVEIELARPAPVAGIELVTGQDRPGDTVHEIWVWTAANEFRGMHTFVGPTRDNQTLTVRFPQPVANVRTVRVATTQSGSNPAWREIRILDQ